MQEIFWNYKATLNSNELNRVWLGMLQPGRYRGFDSMIPSGLTFQLAHTVTGIQQTKEDLTPTASKGILYTKQGYVIQEDANIAGLSCLSNASNAFTRTDLVICTHQDVNVIGGQAATYSVITGPNGSATQPSLPNPTYQTIVGSISIPASASNLTGATYTPATVPLLGGQVFNDVNFPYLKFYALLGGSANNFTKTQRWAKSPAALNIDINNKITYNTDGNLFEFEGISNQVADEMDSQGEGTVIFITNNTAFTLTLNLGATPNGGGIPFVHAGLSTAGLPIYILTGGTGDVLGMVQENNTWKLFTIPQSMYSVIAGHSTGISTLTTTIATQNPNSLITKVIDIGPWNMDSNADITLTHGVPGGMQKIRTVDVLIRDDTPFAIYNLCSSLPSSSNGKAMGSWGLTNTQISLNRLASSDGGLFDSIEYDDISSGYNRGWVTITYAP